MDISEAIDAVPAQKFNGGEEREPRIKLIPFDGIQLNTERQDLIKGLMPRRGLIVLWGKYKCGKSLWLTDAMMCVALGWPYRGRRVHQGSVIYCAFEGQDGFAKRKAAFEQRFLAEDHDAVPFYLQPLRLDLIKEHHDLIDAIKTQIFDSTLVAAVVLDTLNRSLVGSENSDEDMTAYINAADAIREAFGCAVIIVHHCGVDGSRPRGHTSLMGAADAQLAVERAASGIITVKVEFAKDGPEGETLASRLEEVEVGLDADGDPITSCVIEPVEGHAASSTAKQKPLQGNQKTMFSLLYEAGTNGLLTKEWDERGREAGIDAKRRANFFDARMALKNKQLVRQYGDRWTVNHQSP